MKGYIYNVVWNNFYISATFAYIIINQIAVEVYYTKNAVLFRARALSVSTLIFRRK